MLKKLLISIGLLSGVTSHGAISSPTSIGTTTQEGRTVTVTAINDNILKITNHLPGTLPLPSKGVVLEEGDVKNISVGTVGQHLTTLSTATGVTATIDDRTGVLTISSGSGKTVTDDGLRPVADGKAQIRLFTTSAGSFYGGGERGHKLNLRGDTLTMYNRQNYGYTGSDPRINQMNITMPLFLASDGFAILFDDYARAEMVLENPITYITENPRPVTWYYINGTGTLASLTEELTALTGRQDLPPLWSLGYITSKYGYHNRAETLGVVDTLKRAGYPLDGIVLDLYWYGKEQDMGRLAWDPDQWPDAAKMLSTLKKKGVNLVAISQPYILRNGRGLNNYNELAANNMLLKDSVGQDQDVTIWVGEGGMFDVSNEATRQWMRQRYKDLTDGGITGWWGDLGEPEVHPLSGLHANGLTTPLYHNQYGNDWSQIIYDLFKDEYPDRRLLTMMRGGTTGLQRFSVFPWSTDVSRSWGGLEPQVRIMLNSGLSGLGYMGHDVGGFAVDPENPYLPELYVRWLQLGLFSPMLRTHAQQFAEPYKYPQYASIIEKIIKERYRWLPYNYTLAYENATKGYPLVRPLNFTDATRQFDGVSDEFLWGSEVLVAPVMSEGATERDILFPAGTWYDFYNPMQAYSAYSDVKGYAAPLEKLPLFVKAGSFLPMADYKMENTGDYDPARLTVNYYPSNENSSYELYDDNRISPSSLENKQYRLLTFEASNAGKRIIVTSKGTYEGAANSLSLTFVIHRATKPSQVKVNGRIVSPKFKADENTLTFNVKWPVNRQLKIELN